MYRKVCVSIHIKGKIAKDISQFLLQTWAGQENALLSAHSVFTPYPKILMLDKRLRQFESVKLAMSST